MAAPCKPRSHAALKYKLLNNIKKGVRVYFNRRMKIPCANSTYILFVQTMHSVIHKDCGQFFRPQTRLIGVVKCDYANLLVPAMQFKVSRFF